MRLPSMALSVLVGAFLWGCDNTKVVKNEESSRLVEAHGRTYSEHTMNLYETPVADVHTAGTGGAGGESFDEAGRVVKQEHGCVMVSTLFEDPAPSLTLPVKDLGRGSNSGEDYWRGGNTGSTGRYSGSLPRCEYLGDD